MGDSRGLGTLTPDDFQRVRRLFEQALDRPSGDRPAFLEHACNGNTLLMAEVERMLAADGREHHLLDAAAQGVREAHREGQPTSAPADVVSAFRRTAAASTCPACQAAIATTDRFCRACGTPVVAGVFSEEGRFRAGALFAGRFRIVAALGRGGMGDVYRADDLELGQPVALKFLTAFRSDERSRTRLRTEVRLARQISHPNVCRVYDIGEVHGELYLSMEYVDGEDLAALLKRIGRLPIDKGIEVARKLCAGLAAAHARGVLHRDFKPANIMIDGHGEVRIMDFGLAAIADRLDRADVRSGTPAYMAPEQLAGRESTRQSDIYALGLVLYELFTGRPAFEARDVQDLARQRESRPASTPSSHVPEVGPVVERAILRCLEPDPRQRPTSALEVASSLPGGNPLADALAAGETPSPEMVAAAGPTDALRPAVAVSLLTGIGLGLAMWCWLTPPTQMVSQLPFEHSPEVLASKAREIAASLGYTLRPVDTASGFRDETDRYAAYVERQMSGTAAERKSRWSQLLGSAPSPISFWYREADAPLVPLGPLGIVTMSDPPAVTRGMVSMQLGLDGRLLRFTAQPGTDRSEQNGDPGAPDWSRLFDAAGLDLGRFTPAVQDESWAGDEQIWTGVYPGPGAFPVRVVATSTPTRVTSFAIVFPWSPDADASGRAVAAGLDGSSLGTGLSRSLNVRGEGGMMPPIVSLVMLCVVGFVARRNWVAGRVDHSGAWRLALLCFFAPLVGLHLVTGNAALLIDFVGGPGLQGLIAVPLIAVAFYLGIEPWARRHWPETLITWSRAVSGRWRDPVVGRDVLIGLLGAVATSCAYRVMYLWIVNTGGVPDGVALSGPEGVGGGGFGFTLVNLMGARQSAGAMLISAVVGLQNSLVIFFILFLCRILLRRSWLAAAATAGVLSLTFWGLLIFGQTTPEGWFAFALLILLTIMSTRYGFFALTVWVWFGQFVEHAMLTPDFGAWYGQSSLLAVIVVSATALWAFRTSLGGRPLLAPRLEP
jgi:serine/threonine-protein kinase